MTEVNELLSDANNEAITMADDTTGVLVDWWVFSNKPQAIIEARLSGGWYPLQCDVHSFRASMGRDLTDEPVETGTATIVIDNTDGRYTRLTNGDISLSNGTEIRLRLRHPTYNNSPFGESVVWMGNVVEVSNQWSRVENRVTVTAVDPLALLAEQGGALGWRSGDLADSLPERLWHLLERVGLSGVRTYFEHDELGQGLTNPVLRQVSVLAEAHRTALTDGGRFQAEPTADGDAMSFVYLGRDRIGSPPPNIQGFLTGWIPRSTVNRSVPVGDERVVSSSTRPGQDEVWRFSDWCGPGRDSLPYVGLSEVTWRGWERPSIVAVSNEADQEVRDKDGELQPVAWPEVGALASTGSKRHRIIEYTQLRMRSERDASELAEFYAELHARANIVVDELVVAPHASGLDPAIREQLWDAIAGPNGIRQGDWVSVERHLPYDRFVATCSVEGITYSLLPSESGGEPDWTVTYRLHALSVSTYPIPPDERPPLPPGRPTDRPPLPPSQPEVELTAVTLTERGNPPWLFVMGITDPIEPARHEAFAWNSEYGTVRLSLAAQGTYNANHEITRQYANVQLAPGEWLVWVRDAAIPARLSQQHPVQVVDWAGIDITNFNWNPNGDSVLTVTDGRFPLARPRLYADGKRSDEMQLPIKSWSVTGNPDTSNTYTVTFDASGLMPDEWQFKLRDPLDFQRESNIVDAIKDGPSPTGFRLGNFTKDERKEEEWDSIPVAWNAVIVNGVRADRYRIEYREVSDPNANVVTRTSTTPSTTFTGARSISSGVQTEREYEFRVQAVVNGHDGLWSGWHTVRTGYPYMIHRTDYVNQSPGGWADSTQEATITLPAFRPTTSGSTGVGSGQRPNWTQDADPYQDNFVGVHVRQLSFSNLESKGIAPNGTPITHPKLRFYGVGPLDDVRQVIRGSLTASVPSNPDTPWTGSWSMEQAGGGAYGVRLTGSAWGPRNQPGGSWIEFGAMTATGYLYTFYSAKWPVVI